MASYRHKPAHKLGWYLETWTRQRLAWARRVQRFLGSMPCLINVLRLFLRSIALTPVRCANLRTWVHDLRITIHANLRTSNYVLTITMCANLRTSFYILRITIRAILRTCGSTVQQVFNLFGVMSWCLPCNTPYLSQAAYTTWANWSESKIFISLHGVEGHSSKAWKQQMFSLSDDTFETVTGERFDAIQDNSNTSLYDVLLCCSASLDLSVNLNSRHVSDQANASWRRTVNIHYLYQDRAGTATRIRCVASIPRQID